MDVFNYCDSISLYHGLISRILFVLLNLSYCCFSWTDNMSSLALIFHIEDTFCSKQFLTKRKPVFQKNMPLRYKITTFILPQTRKFIVFGYIIKPELFPVSLSLTISEHKSSTLSDAIYE